LNQTVNPMQAVAFGATLHATHCLNPSAGQSKVAEIVPRAIGMETMGGKMDVVIPKGVPIGGWAEKGYSTCNDNQTFINVVVYEGDGQFVKDNKRLDSFKISGLTPLPRG